ncbi:response regulator transcription factor [Pedobacter psychrodurus]|uniref:Response regulator transcription factor n=1 Tax=Pedobacter psychrodurus TaxID=2530456 RepID=A0A4V2MR96_9SPHI|nr:LytTR family DNA-binding domain-containing protein [Pedobacter psychrodurus]TCD28587.1 response regulator transcription factor [Pedobacter psychrodurus]
MISALIVDDEVINIDNLKALLNRHCKEIDVVATAQSADEAEIHIFNLNPDVVFLDIEMPVKNGFDLLRSLNRPDFDVVFVTAYNAYGIMAVKFSALDYLLKPINIAELKITVDKIIRSVKARKQNVRLNNLLNILDKEQISGKEKIALATLKETYLVPVKDIMRCVSSNNYTTFFLSDGKQYLISKPLYEYEEMLSPYGFIRCHQSHLVNRAYVTSILYEDSGYLILSHTDQKIPISRQRKTYIKAMLNL